MFLDGENGRLVYIALALSQRNRRDFKRLVSLIVYFSVLLFIEPLCDSCNIQSEGNIYPESYFHSCYSYDLGAVKSILAILSQSCSQTNLFLIFGDKKSCFIDNQ